MSADRHCVARLAANEAAGQTATGGAAREHRLRFARLSGQTGRRARRLAEAARRRG